MKELFEIQPCDSPRLKWMKKHGVHTMHNKGVNPGDECDVTGETLYPWCAYVGVNVFPKPEGLLGCGNTEDEAICELAKRRGWKLWNEE